MEDDSSTMKPFQTTSGDTVIGTAPKTFRPYKLAHVQEKLGLARKVLNWSGELLPMILTEGSSFDNPDQVLIHC